MKAVLQYRASPGFRTRIADTAPAWLTVEIVDEDDAPTFDAAMADAHVLLHVLKPVTAAVIGAAPRLALIQKLGVGLNTIDLDAARAHGVGVANMPGTNTAATAEMTVALLLALLRRVPALDAATRRGRGWHVDPAAVDQAGEIAGRVVGLVGAGAVARRVAAIATAFGAEVVFANRRPVPEMIGRQVPLPELLATADVVSLHVPLAAETERLVDAAALARMKPGAVLVNTARGGLVDEAALVDALRSGRLRGAALDVFGEEPIPADHPFLTLDNVVVTPHLAWLTPETFDRSLDVAFDNCRRLRDGEPLRHVVVPPGQLRNSTSHAESSKR